MNKNQPKKNIENYNTTFMLYFAIIINRLFNFLNLTMAAPSDKKERKREAVKKTIANMTVGKDVSALFPDVINCIQTDNLGELKYLFIDKDKLRL